jgi:hypothetical protein
MPKYKTKSVIVEAVRWFKMGDHDAVILIHNTPCISCSYKTVHIPVCPGDWIITGPNGEITVTSDEKFKKLYEPVLFEIGVMKAGESFKGYCEKNHISYNSLPEVTE